jgi:hypothetical protein
VSVTSSNWSLFALSGNLTAGTHELAFVFDNDAYAPPEDRNLYLDLVRYGPEASAGSVRALTRPGVLVEVPCGRGLILLDEVNWENPGQHLAKAERLASSLLTRFGAAMQSPRSLTLEAEQMTPVEVAAGATNNGVVWLYSSGRLQTRVRFTETGLYHFEITGQGTPAQGVFPKAELRIDGVARGSVEVASATPATFTLSTSIAAGTHTVALAFTNDLYALPEDRNLGLDRLSIRPEPRPEILDLQLPADHAQATLAWTATPGRSYDIESRADFASGAWSTLGSAAAVGTVATWIDDGTVAGSPPGSANRPQGCYRIRTRLP